MKRNSLKHFCTAILLVMLTTIWVNRVCAANYTVNTSAQLSNVLTEIPIGQKSEITLTADISFYSDVYVNRGTKIIFHLAGHKLNIYGWTRADMLSAITIDDALAGSELNALGGIRVSDKESLVTVTNASDPESAFEIPAGAYDGGTIIIKGNLNSGHDTAIQSYDKDSSGKPSSVTVNGDVISAHTGYCIRADGGGEILLHGNLQSKESGAMAGNGAKIIIDGNVSCGNGYGVYASKASTIVVNGTIAATLPIAIEDSDLAPTNQDVKDGYTVYTRNGPDKSIVKVKIPNSTSAIENPANELLRVFPNPTSEIIRIYPPNGESINRVEVFNIQGKQVLNVVHPLVYDFDLSGFPIGIYLIEIQSKSGIYNRKIIKK